jgi:hypothetical protein
VEVLDAEEADELSPKLLSIQNDRMKVDLFAFGAEY